MDDRRCHLCSSADLRAAAGAPGVLRCAGCGLMSLAEFPAAAERASRYQGEYYEEGSGERFLGPFERAVRWFRLLRMRDILRRLPPRSDAAGERPLNGPEARDAVARPDAFLDVGCGRGLLLECFRSRGWEAVGTQLSETAARACGRRAGPGVTVRVGELPALGLPERAFRAAALYHVLEHVAAPLDYLVELRRVLRDDGLLVVEVPDLGGAGFRVLGRRHFCFDWPHHLWFFTPATLERMLAAAGFAVRARRRFSLEYSPFTTLQNVLNLVPGEPNRLYRSFMRNADGARLRRQPLTWAHALLGAAVSVPALALSLASVVLPAGNTVRFYCVKAASARAESPSRVASATETVLVPS